jgi:hypothetical protein
LVSATLTAALTQLNFAKSLAAYVSGKMS